MNIAKIGGKCDISFFLKMCYLWSTLDSIFRNPIGHLKMFTQNIFLTLIIVIRVRVDFQCRVIFPYVRA